MYPPGPLTWDEIIAAICALPERITGDDVGTVATLAGILGVFGFPEGSAFRRETRAGDKALSVTVTLSYEGKEYTFVDTFDYTSWLHSDGTVARTAFEVAEYMYTEGNYGCDCNRSAFLARHCGVDFRPHGGAIDEGDDGEWSLDCGREIKLVRLDDVAYEYDERLGFEIPASEKAERDKRVVYEQRASGIYVPYVEEPCTETN